MRTGLLRCLAAVALAAGCTAPEEPVAMLFADGNRWVDLSYGYGPSTIYWPTSAPFRLEVVARGTTPGGYYYAANSFCTAEHGGTHLDAPVHFAEGRWTADQIPLERFIGPAVVVDVAAQGAADPDYRVTVADLEAFERAHGAIAAGTIVLIRTGWGAYWPDRSRYLGTDRTGPEAVPLLHFPGLAPEAAEWLVHRNVDAVGIDTPSIDRGQSTSFEAHRILFRANVPAFENVARLDALPPRGAYVVALPMKIEGGTGGPLRLVAALPASR